MKKILYFLCGLALTGCINDVENINPQQTTELDADALFSKVYATFVLTGQEGPSNSGDLINMDEGRSQYTRMIWNLNELTSDEAHWHWYMNDTGYDDLVANSYGADNAVSQGFFYRTFFNITLCNLYLKNVENTSEETAKRRAEVRFIRAYNYYNVMDLFGNGPFSEEFEMGQTAPYYTRDQYFAFLEKELKELAGESNGKEVLEDDGASNYGRVKKSAALLLLSRLYLNAEVYTGTARWAEAKEYASKVMNSSYYKLCTAGKGGYTAYQLLFLADNNENGAQYEAIFPILHDGLTTKSYGGMHALILSCYSNNDAMGTDIPSGTDNNWGKCAFIRGTLADIFFGVGTDANTKDFTTCEQATSFANDDRALIYTKGYARYSTSPSDQQQGYACAKFRNVRSDGRNTSTNDGYVDTDQPLMRMAEAYLNYAEADARMNGGVTTADGAAKINALRTRANANAYAQSYSLADIRNEWAKEFWFEGRRRMDLVRFGAYAGQSDYKWDWMSGTQNGNQFAAFRNIYGIPSAELTNNANIKQNAGY